MKEDPTPAAERARGQRLLFVTVLFGVLLNFPLLAVFTAGAWRACPCCTGTFCSPGHCLLA